MIEGPVRQAGVGVGCAALGWAVVAGLYHLVGAPIAFFFLLVTFTAALTADRVGGVTAILSSITSVYYFTEPVGWRMTPSGAISIVIFLAASGAMVEVITRMHAAIVARDALMSVVSHDLRTPLSSLSLREQRLLLTLEKQGPPPPDELRRHAESALHLIRGLASMIENLLDLGRLHSRHLELAPADADLARIVGNVVGDMLPAINAAGSRLDTAGFDQPCPGFWDAVAMERVVGNLLSNAIKYGNGKPIEVTLERTSNAFGWPSSTTASGSRPTSRPACSIASSRRPAARAGRTATGWGCGSCGGSSRPTAAPWRSRAKSGRGRR